MCDSSVLDTAQLDIVKGLREYPVMFEVIEQKKEKKNGASSF
jgi:hypothetical protein